MRPNPGTTWRRAGPHLAFGTKRGPKPILPFHLLGCYAHASHQATGKRQAHNMSPTPAEGLAHASPLAPRRHAYASFPTPEGYSRRLGCRSRTPGPTPSNPPRVVKPTLPIHTYAHPCTLTHSRTARLAHAPRSTINMAQSACVVIYTSNIMGDIILVLR